MPKERIEIKSLAVCVPIVFVPGGKIGSLGELGAEVGAWIAIEGIEIGIGGGARFGGGVTACGDGSGTFSFATS